MKIIKTGRIPEEKTHRLTCRNCGTVFEITQKEGRVHHDQREGMSIEHPCPVCDKPCWAYLGSGK